MIDPTRYLIRRPSATQQTSAAFADSDPVHSFPYDRDSRVEKKESSSSTLVYSLALPRGTLWMPLSINEYANQ